MNAACGILLVLFLGMRARAHTAAADGDPRAACDRVSFVGRREWRARPPVRTFPMALPVGHVIVLDTVSRPCHGAAQCVREVQFVQDYHLDDKGWWDIAYSFLIGGDGRVYVGVGWSDCAEHTVNYNTISIGVSFVGNFSAVAPAPGMVRAALDLIDCGVAEGYLTPSVEVHGHRDVTCSDAPGDALYAIIRRWKNFKGGRLPRYDCRA